MAASRVIAVVFDLDDTLFSERAYVFSGFDAVAAAFEDHLGDRARAAAQMRELFDSEHRPRVFNALLSRLRDRAAASGLSESSPEESTHTGFRGSARDHADLVRHMVQTYREHVPSISLHADADAALARVRRTHKLGLITDGPVASQSAKVDALGLRPRLDVVILTDELGPGFAKPNPRAYELIAQRLSVDPSQCAYIADNAAKDFVAPNALGWTTIQIKRLDGIYRANVPTTGGTPQHVIHTLADIDRYV